MGVEAKQFLIQAIAKAEEDKKFILEEVQNQENMEEVVEKLSRDFLEQTRFPFLPPEIQKTVTETVVRKILEGKAE